MSLLQIVTEPDPILHKVAAPIEHLDDSVQLLIDDMIETMYEAPGVGLAAPQVDHSIQLAVVDWKQEVDDEGWVRGEAVTLINPSILHSEGEASVEEGCLSVPEFTVEVPRWARIVVQAMDRGGQEIELDLEGFAAIVVQHELDHLKGITLLNRVSSLRRSMYLKRKKKAQIRDAAAD